MEIRYYKHYSGHLGRDMEFKVYGHAGKPVLFIPCQAGRFIDFEGFKMTDVWAKWIDAGKVTVYSIDTIDNETWADKGGDPRRRIERHEQWYNYVVEELVPTIHWSSGRRDILTFGASMGGYHAVNTDYSKDVWYQDITVFASMAATCFHEYYNETSITYYRVADVYRSGLVITKETYDEYKALEEAMHKKGYTDFTTEVWYDDVHDCYRGPAFRNASLDGVHVVSSKGGAQVISSVFERLGDDGTNQFGGYARLSAVRDNGDGTMDLIYKGNLSEYWFYSGTGSSTRTAHTSLRRFEPGHHMIVYTNGGNLVLDATAISTAVS